MEVTIKKPGKLKILRNKIKGAIALHPVVFYWVYKLLGPEHIKGYLTSPNSEIVIEGFPRSANTFAYHAFLLAQDRPVEIGHHLHSEAQVLLGIKFRKPVLVLIRDPESSVRSLCVRHPTATQEAALKKWIRYYSCVLENIDNIVVADFVEVVSDFGAVIERVNKKFNKSFIPFEANKEAVDNVNSEIKKMNAKRGEDNELQVNSPSKLREKKYESFEVEEGDLLVEARSLYETILSHSA